jgi:hypothetical protein
MVEPRPEVETERERLEIVEVELPVPEEEEDKEELEETNWPMSNWLVWESTVLTFPTGEAWKLYPEPG